MKAAKEIIIEVLMRESNVVSESKLEEIAKELIKELRLDNVYYQSIKELEEAYETKEEKSKEN